MFKFQLPIHRGTDLFPEVMQAATVVHVRVVTKKPIAQTNVAQEARRILDPIRGLVMHFYISQRHNLHTGVAKSVRVHRQFVGCDVIYTSRFGTEIIDITLFPDVVPYKKDKEPGDCMVVFFEGNKIAAIPMKQLDDLDFTPTYASRLASNWGEHRLKTAQYRFEEKKSWIFSSLKFTSSANESITVTSEPNHGATYIVDDTIFATVPSALPKDKAPTCNGSGSKLFTPYDRYEVMSVPTPTGTSTQVIRVGAGGTFESLPYIISSVGDYYYGLMLYGNTDNTFFYMGDYQQQAWDIPESDEHDYYYGTYPRVMWVEINPVNGRHEVFSHGSTEDKRVWSPNPLSVVVPSQVFSQQGSVDRLNMTRPHANLSYSERDVVSTNLAVLTWWHNNSDPPGVEYPYPMYVPPPGYTWYQIERYYYVSGYGNRVFLQEYYSGLGGWAEGDFIIPPRFYTVYSSFGWDETVKYRNWNLSWGDQWGDYNDDYYRDPFQPYWTVEQRGYAPYFPPPLGDELGKHVSVYGRVVTTPYEIIPWDGSFVKYFYDGGPQENWDGWPENVIADIEENGAVWSRTAEFKDWLHASNGEHFVQGYSVNNQAPRLWLDRRDISASLPAALGTTVEQIQTILMDIPLANIKKFV